LNAKAEKPADKGGSLELLWNSLTTKKANEFTEESDERQATNVEDQIALANTSFKMGEDNQVAQQSKDKAKETEVQNEGNPRGSSRRNIFGRKSE